MRKSPGPHAPANGPIVFATRARRAMHPRRLKSASLALLSFAAATLLAACGGGSSGGGAATTPPPPATTYTATRGVAQKGPLVAGAAVTVQELGLNLASGGSAYSYTTTGNLGAFTPDAKFLTPNVSVTATGAYADEVANAVSDGPVTLQSYADITTPTALNVNLLTTLAYTRTNHLVNQGASSMSIAAARAQAEGEVLRAFGIAVGTPIEAFGTLDIGGTAGASGSPPTTTDGDHILAALSALVVQGRSSADVGALIAAIQADIATNGTITSAATRQTLAASAQALNLNRVAANLTALYAASGTTFDPRTLAEWIDQDGDGVIGHDEFRVDGATAASTFTLPSDFAAAHAGALVGSSTGTLSVNGTAATAPVMLKAGDVVTLAAPATLPDGVLKAYLTVGTTPIARVAFVKGLASIAITPASGVLPIGLAQRFVATGTFGDGSTADVSGAVTWASSAPGVADIDAASGLSDALTLGTTTISATSGSVSGTLSLNASAAAIQSIVISPATLQTGVGITRRFTASGTFSDGSVVDVSAGVAWSTTTPGIAAISQGAASGLALGTTPVTATLNGVSASAVVAVTTDTWTASPAMPTERVGGHTATLLPGGKLLVAGGVGANGAGTANVDLFDPVAASWIHAAPMATQRTSHTATLLADGRVLVTGGSTVSTAAAKGYVNNLSAEIYDPVANQWTAAAPMSVARSHHTATRLPDGRVLVVGGENASYLVGATAEIYDPALDTWTVTATPPVSARSQHTATLLPDGQVLLAGGFDIELGILTPLDTSELYDPVAGTFTVTAIYTTTGTGTDAVTTATPTPMAFAQSGQTATLLPDGRVLLAGGGNALAELYDPATQTWATTGSMGAAHTLGAAALLPNGQVLVVGGTQSALPSAERFDPASGTWTAAAAMLVVPGSATATVLQDGSALVCGGAPNTAGVNCETYW